MPRVVAKIDSARERRYRHRGRHVRLHGVVQLHVGLIPPWAHNGGTAKLIERLRDPAMRRRIRREMLAPDESWDNEWQEISGPASVLIGVVQNPALEAYQGKTLAQVAAARQHGCDRRAVRPAGRGRGLHVGRRVRDVGAGRLLALRQPWVSINNDSQGTAPDGLLGKEHPHPRAYGTFPRILRKYVREERRLTLEDAIRKFTSLPAQRMRLGDRGVLKVGMWADVVVFDPAQVRDRATFAAPNQLSEGMRWVLVNGIPVIADGRATGALPGRVLRGRAVAVGSAAHGPKATAAPAAPDSFPYARRRDLRNRPTEDRAGAYARAASSRRSRPATAKTTSTTTSSISRSRSGSTASSSRCFAGSRPCCRCGSCSPTSWRTRRPASSSSPRRWTWSSPTSSASGSARCRPGRSWRC